MPDQEINTSPNIEAQTPPAPPPMAPYPSEVEPPSVPPKSTLLTNVKLKLTSFGDLTPKIKIFLPRIIIVAIIIVLLITLAPYGIKMLKTKKPAPTPVPTTAPSPTPEISNPSPYANDDEVLAIEKKIEEVEKELQIVNFREDTLRIPSLDWDIKF